MKKIFLDVYRKVVTRYEGCGLSRYYPINKIMQYSVSYLKNPYETVEIHGHKMHLDPKDTLNLSIWGTYEPYETQLFSEALKPGDIVFDIGANIGYYTLIAAKIVGSSGAIFAFEPDNDNYSILDENIKMNGYNNVNLFKKAVSNQNGKMRLYLSDMNRGDHRLYYSGSDRPSIEVDVIRLDDFLENSGGRVNLIKMDIQGSEGRALQGMESLITNQSRLTIFMEFWPSALVDAGTDPMDILNIFDKNGYKLNYINDLEKKTIQLSLDEIVKKGCEMGQINLLICK